MAAVFILVLVVVIAVAAWSWQQKLQRRKDFALLGARLGLTYSQDDPFGTVNLPFALFRKGDGRGVENVLDGELRGRRVRLFDYWYYDESTDSKGRRSRTYHRFSCALGAVAAGCPHLSVTREGVFSRLADHLGLRDLELESEEFNRRFEVRADDRRFAYALLDARMMQWLLDQDGADRFEVLGGQVLVGTRKLPVAAVPNLTLALAGFCDHVPAVVCDLYPLHET